MNNDSVRTKVKTAVRSNKAMGLLRTAGKSLLETTTGVTVGRVVDAAAKAFEAASDARANKKYMEKNYGDEDKATATRRFRHRKANEARDK